MKRLSDHLTPVDTPVDTPTGAQAHKRHTKVGGNERRPSRSRGQIITKARDRHLVRVYIGRGSDGKKKYASRTVYGSPAEARQALTALLCEHDRGSLAQRSVKSVEAYLQEWLTGKKLLPQTLKNYEATLRAYVYDSALARMKVSDVRRQHVQAHYNSLDARGLGARVVQYVHALLHQAFELAVVDELLSRNPTDHTERRTVRRQVTVKVLTPEETVALLKANADDALYPLWLLVLSAGLRPQEALPLKWSDLDLDEGTLRIRRVVAVVAGRQEVQEGRAKTHGSVRTVPLGKTTVAALRAQRQAVAQMQLRCKEWQDHGYVFAGRQGRLRDLQALRRAWKAALTRAGMSERRLYDTRHSHITHLIEAGVPAAVVAERVGNSAAITLSVYTHVLEDTARRTGDTTERLLFG